MFQPTEYRDVQGLQRNIGYAPHIGQTFKHNLQGDPGFQPCQRRSQAKVDAIAEREVPIGQPVDIEAVGFRELAFVMIGRARQ